MAPLVSRGSLLNYPESRAIRFTGAGGAVSAATAGFSFSPEQSAAAVAMTALPAALKEGAMVQPGSLKVR